MGRKRSPGLVKQGGIWHIDKVINGKRICQSTGRTSLKEAEQHLVRMMEDIRQAQVFGVRPDRTFDEAAARFVKEHGHKASLRDDISRLKNLMPWIGHLPLKSVHMGTLTPWIAHRAATGVAPGTINHGLQIVRRILNLASDEWMDEHGLTWLERAPKIRMRPNPYKRLPYPLSWEEQERLFLELPRHLADMALFAVNTGCRDGEICRLRWDWEVDVPTMHTSVFIVPSVHVKNRSERLVILNRKARSVVESRRHIHPTHVFSYQGHPVKRMLNGGWLRARERARLPEVRVHDLKHTFGRRLRAAGVSFEDRQDLLGHRSHRITTHYSSAELSNLIEAADRVCARDGQRPELLVLKRGISGDSRKIPVKALTNGKEDKLNL